MYYGAIYIFFKTIDVESTLWSIRPSNIAVKTKLITFVAFEILNEYYYREIILYNTLSWYDIL